MRLFSGMLGALAVFLVTTGSLVAEIGVTDGCQEDIQKLEDEIKEDRDDYTVESVTKARTQLTAAKTNRLNPVKCRKNIQDARAALREGKRNNKDKK